jgi:hypothetical protein
MTRETASTLPMIELAEILVEFSEEFSEESAVEIAETWDRYDLLEEIQRTDFFDDVE